MKGECIMAQVGLRQYFEQANKKVDYNGNDGSITITDPTSGASRKLGVNDYTNSNGTAYVDQDAAKGLFGGGQQQAPSSSGLNPFELFKAATQWKPTPINEGSLWNSASNKVNQIYNQFQNRINGQISRLDANRNTVMNHLNTNLDNQKQDLGDQTFRNYMAANDQKVKRGIGGMGLANDLDTRVALANNESLKQLDRQYNDQVFSADQNYNTNLNSLQDKLSSFDYQGKLDDAYQSLYRNALKAQANESNPLIDAWKAFGSSLAPDANHVLDNQTDMYKWLNPSADNILDNKTKIASDMLPYQFQTVNNQADNKRAVDIANQNTQFDYAKLKQTAYDNAADRNLKWDINAANLAEKKDEFGYSLDMKAKTLQNTAYNQQAQQQATLGKNYVAVANQAATRIKQYESAGQPVPTELQKAYDEAMANAKTANDNLAKLVSSAGGGSNFQMPN
jgi:hypothetical protein